MKGTKKMNEEYITKRRAVELWDNNLLQSKDAGTVKELRRIHAYLFQDVFDFAGELRTVNLSKGNFRFAPVLFLEQNLKIIEKMPQDTFDEIIEKYVEMNVAHPFREGNGRATRIWLDEILKAKLGKCIDWTKVDKTDYLSAMERSPVNPLELKTLLVNALTEDIENREVYMRGIQSSYRYEDMGDIDIFKMEE
ncbi:Fic family protein [Peptostreptococcaceae bacterium oral taxon 113 str. W5053]|nr:Fic family protein [Peptostreptococcaceae bacterium oral taxon 113 str. W5053]